MRKKKQQLHKKWKFMVLAGLYFLTVILEAGCGGECQSQRGHDINVSNSAVSGDALNIKKDTLYCHKDPLCNDRNIYKWTDKGIEQRTLEGELLQTISFGKCGWPVYVTDDEIFCTTGTTDNGKEQLWSVPIEKGPEADVVHPEHASFILEDETVGWGSYFYADADQIIYIEPYDFKVFDRKQGKYIKLKNNPTDKKGMPNGKIYIEDCMCDGYILFQCKYDGLYVYKLGSDRVTLVDEMSHGSYISAGYGKKHQIIYERCEICQPGKEASDHTASLYIYDCLTGEKQPFMNDKQWKEVYKKSGIYKDNIDYLDGDDFNWKSFYIDNDILYLVDINNAFVFSIDLGRDQMPHYERQLSEWLQKTEYEVTTFDHGRCHILYENNRSGEEGGFCISGYYDLEKNEYVETERK